jgi:hypothetical protein
MQMSATGRWNATAKTPMGEQRSTFELKQNGTQITGMMTSPDSAQIYEGSAKGNELSWKVDIKTPLSLKIKVTATIDADTMKGKAKAGMFPASEFTAQRSQG